MVFPCTGVHASLTGMTRRFGWFVCVLLLGGSFFVHAFDLPTKTSQYSDGRIVFSEANAKRGEDGSLSWSYRPTRWGMYSVEGIFEGVTEATDIRIEIAGQTLGTSGVPKPDLAPFGSLTASVTYFPEAKPYEVRAISKSGNKLKGVLLRPAPEGQPIAQREESITLQARDATTHGIMMRYEPATNKNCLGFWTNPRDAAEWKFAVTKPGDYEVELWQGCGKGQGGSDVMVQVLGSEAVLKQVRFVVEETGHFQNFAPRKLGVVHFAAAGAYSLWVRPEQKKAAAVMDIQRIVLLPAKGRAGRAPANQALRAVLDSRRVVFLGDSITYGGEYIDLVEAYVRLEYPEATVEFINLGLPSETVSGFSEPGHAGGEFRRPVLRERLTGVLKKARPDLIVACYGMNDGVYYPFSEERFRRFQEGINVLRRDARSAKAQVVYLTPPTFDPVPLKGRTLPAGLEEYKSPFEGYNQVLDKYSDWLVARGKQGFEVVDVHTPMNKFLAEQRKKDPAFLLAGDGVHANAQGHWLIAREILRHWGAPESITTASTAEALLSSSPRAPEILKLVQQRQRVIKDAWLTHTGHSRPGMNKGKPLEEAEREAREIGEKLKKFSS